MHDDVDTSEGTLDTGAEDDDGGALSIEIELTRTVNYAMQQNDVPVVHELRLVNDGAGLLADIRIRIVTEPLFAVPWETRIAVINPGATFVLRQIDLPLSHDYLATLTERVVGTVHVEADQAGRRLASRSERIEVLAYDEWNGLGTLPEILTAFVTPNHPCVESLLSSAASELVQETGSGSLSGYQAHSRERVKAMVRAIYVALQKARIRYINPPASFEETGQKIRLPDRILENRLGTCLDLTVLAAACFEQAGLHPLIILTKGHALAGAWLVDECFPSTTLDSPLPLKKRVELDEVCVFETTMVTAETPIPFERAAEAGRRCLEEPEGFRCAIDVLRARKSRIRPLPLRAAVVQPDGQPAPSVGPAPTYPATTPEPVQRPPRSAHDTERETSEAPAARIELWKRKLLDLTLRNRLLNFRPSSRKALRVLCPNLPALEDALSSGERFRIFARPTDFDGPSPRDPSVHAQRTGEDLLGQLLLEEFQSRRLHADVSESELGRRLLEIFREARLSLEEGGANILYLAMGNLAWYDSPSSTERRLAPIILVPLEMERHSVQEGFAIRRSDEEPMINVTLLEWLKREFDLAIPGVDPVPQDERGCDVEGVLMAFRQAVRDIDRWDVLDDAYIGLFSFTKFLMWKDLDARTAELQRNRVVDHLINKPNGPFPDEGGFPDPDSLDEAYTPDQTYCPLDADSSQLAAVHAAAAGKTFVLQGPPGTGKSQTITNIIAHALACGKSVLFVSEKMAALTVVHKRLAECGLGPFCLQLHSNKARKQEVLGQLAEALDVVESRSPEEWRHEAERLASVRRELNEYVRELHKPREIGESLFQSLSRLIGLRDVSPVVLGWPPDAPMDRARLDLLRDTVEELQAAATDVGQPSQNPWAPAGCWEWTPSLRTNVEDAIRRCRASVEDLARLAYRVSAELGLDGSDVTVWSEEQLALTDAIATHILQSPGPPMALVADEDWDIASRSMGEWIEHGRRRDGLRSLVYERYTKEILGLDLDGLSMRIAAADASSGLRRWLGRIAVWRALRRVTRPACGPALDSLGRDVRAALSLREEERCVQDCGDQARKLLERFWHDGEANWDEIASIAEWTSTLRALAARVAGERPEVAAGLRRRWALLSTEKRAELGPHGSVGQLFRSFQSSYVQFVQCRRDLEVLLDVGSRRAWGDPVNPGLLRTVVSRLDGWANNLVHLRSWCHWQRARRRAADCGLQSLVAACEQHGLPPSELVRTFNRAFYQWWVDRVTDSVPILRQFFSRDFERKIQQFREIDLRFTRLTRERIRAVLSARVPRPGQAVPANSEMGILVRQTQMKRRHMPIRQLFQRIPNTLPLVKPCLLMSPISVAQYLDPAYPPFDLVVFDEASQIPVWDAIGALARGREAVIVGDPKQLPPTSFFDRIDDVDLQEDEIKDLESILDDCIAAQMPRMDLQWHYRSRHESLIAFSNQQYYGNRLLTFPSPEHTTAVSLRLVPGVYDRSRSCTNRKEAEAVVAEAVRRLRDPELPRESIGIVTFSIQQQTMVEDLLDEARRAHGEIEPFFTSSVAEPVFVKNLENVQGDERDVILFSVCYGPDAQGRIAMNFGPLNRDGGERRLNVAITRARKAVVVFSSIRADQIDLARSRARGVADLKYFLDYAERGPQALLDQRGEGQGGDFESPFEQQVCEALRQRGYEVHVQVGCSGYRIDLAIVDPDKPGRYLLGIECDGANYHRAKTARDRDRLRAEVLRERGWRLHRVWSTDWWERPLDELARIEAAIDDARRAPRALPQPATTSDDVPLALDLTACAVPPIGQPIEREVQRVAAMPQRVSAARLGEARHMQEYRRHPCPEAIGNLAAFYDPSSNGAIVDQIESVVEAEGPISLDLLMTRVAEYWGIRRVGKEIDSRIRRLLRSSKVQRRQRHGRVFVWRADANPAEFEDFRVPAAGADWRRSAADLPPEEVANAALYVLAQSVSLPRGELVVQIARVFGFGRTGSNVSNYIDDGIALLLEQGSAREVDGMVIAESRPGS